MELVSESDPILHKQLARFIWPEGTEDFEFMASQLLAQGEAMIEFIREHDMRALAANQVGSDHRMLVYVEFANTESPVYTICVCPEVLERIGETTGVESCANFPEIEFEISRPTHLVFEAADVRGQLSMYAVPDEIARAVVQAIDLLDGITLFDIAG